MKLWKKGPELKERLFGSDVSELEGKVPGRGSECPSGKLAE